MGVRSVKAFPCGMCSQKKQKTIELKEVRLSPNIDTNDLNTKVNAARKFLEKGDRVKVTLRFRGREMAHMATSKHILDDFAEGMADCLNNNFNSKILMYGVDFKNNPDGQSLNFEKLCKKLNKKPNFSKAIKGIIITYKLDQNLIEIL